MNATWREAYHSSMPNVTIGETESVTSAPSTETDSEDKRAAFDDELELWILASST